MKMTGGDRVATGSQASGIMMMWLKAE